MKQMVRKGRRETDTAAATDPDYYLFDVRSLVAAIIGAVGFFMLATSSLALSKFDSTLASVWLPNAAAVAFLLRARLASEVPFYLAVFVSSTLANLNAGTALDLALLFTLANLIDIRLVAWLIVRRCDGTPDMTYLPHLANFIWIGGILGPLISATISSLGMAPDAEAMRGALVAWFLTDSMGMIIVVPTALLIVDAIQGDERLTRYEIAERSLIMLGGTASVFLVFRQDIYPLLFAVPPITLFYAFRMGSLGTALYIAAVAVVSSVMTYIGYGPIEQATSSATKQSHLVQAFIVANFLTGLPVAAILAGRDRMVRDLADGKRALDLLADNITDAILRFDLEGLCTYASPSVRDVLDDDPSAFVGKRATDRMHQDARAKITGALSRLISGETDKERITYRRFLDGPDDTPVFIEADCAIAFDPETNEREAIVVSARDVTERVELELLLTRARKHAENAARAKSEFLANMSHEIRTPMNGVLGFAELLLHSELDEDQERQAEMIVQSGRTMMLLLNDILDLSKVEAGQITVAKTAVNLHETVAECAALHRPKAEEKGLELHVSCENNCGDDACEDAWITTDALRVRQIVLNLIGNAVKFTEHGRIDIDCRIDCDRFMIQITDTGIGISASRLDSIFQPFAQAESDTARRFGGTGLGLTISRQLAELLGGVLEVQSEPGAGSCFTLILPCSPAAPEELPQPADEPLSLETLPSDTRILLAEDQKINRVLATEMLERCGQSVAVAHDGNEAISMVIDSVMRGVPYDLVLMDIQMPGCDGYAATRAIRGEKITADDLPIIALTANAFPEDIAAARDAGMQGHLAKPLNFAELARMLQRWLPTRIVEDEPRTQIASGSTFGEGQTQTLLKSSDLNARWIARRTEAIEAIRGLLAGDHLPDDEKLAETARIIHKIAGTAAMFDEEELGTQAAHLERALRSGAGEDDIRELACVLMNLAQETSDEDMRQSA